MKINLLMKMGLLKETLFTPLTPKPLLPEYVVTAKWADKLIIRHLSRPDIESILVCGKSDQAKLFHQAVNIGDTLTCPSPKIDCGEYVYTGHMYEEIPFKKINGRDARDVMWAVKRDSVIARAHSEIQQTR